MADESLDNQDSLLTGSLRRTVFVFALPVLCEQFLIFLVGFVDTYLSGRISAEATSATGLSAYVGWLASMLFGLIGAGTTALVARHWGAREFDRANEIMNRSLVLGTIMGLATGVVIYWSAAPFASLLGMKGETYGITVDYLQLASIGHLASAVTLVGTASLRGAGDMRTPMFVLGTVCIVNVILSTLLVYGPGPIPSCGVSGIVFGTVVARYVGLILTLVVFIRGKSGLKWNLSQMRFERTSTGRILRIGVPAALDGAATWAGQFAFLMIIARLNQSAGNFEFAAHMVGIRVEGITYLPAVAWGLAASTLVGQSLGAKQPERAVRGGYEAVIQCCVPVLAISLLFYYLAPQIFSLMHQHEDVRKIGVPAFRMLSFFQIPLIVSIVFVLALRGAGDTKVPMWINVGCVVLVRVPLAYLFGIVLEGGLIGAWIGMCVDVSLRGLLFFVRFRRRKWTEIVV